MIREIFRPVWPMLLVLGCLTIAADLQDSMAFNRDMLEALKPFAPCVGEWSAVVQSASAEDANASVECTWGFRDSDGRVSLNFYFRPDAVLKVALLTFDPASKNFAFVAKDHADKRISFGGPPNPKVRQALQLPAEADRDRPYDRCEIALAKGGDKLLISLSKRVGKSAFRPVVSFEAFRQGRSNADFETGPFCIVTGGPGRIEVRHGDKTVHVACEGSKELFLKRPELFLKP